MTRILLVAPERRINGLDETHFSEVVKSASAPADLATVAALTPDTFRVDIWDEAVRGRVTEATVLPRDYALVGVGGYTSDLDRALELGRLFRARGVPVVVGGVGVSSEPNRYRDVFDVLFIGEAEHTWPKFLADFTAGHHQREYRQVTRVDLADSPAPRWDLLAGDIDKYAYTVVQTTRGCPFDCEFCDVITLFGRQPRHKSIPQVLDEVRALEALGASAVLLADDNIYGQPKYYKDLLGELAELNRTFRHPLRFWAQITLNMSNDDQMLDLLVRANVSSILIGIESPNVESLVETRKPQNYKLDLVRALHKIESYGLRIEASLIVGFDNDDRTIFDQQFAFIQEACLTPVSIWTLYAMPGTRLWSRLQKEHRVFEEPRLKRLAGLNARTITNVVPKQMTLEELYRGYRDLLVRVHDWDAFEARLTGLVDRIERFPEDMLRVRSASLRRVLRLLYGIAFTLKGRQGVMRWRADIPAQAILQRLLARIQGESPRARFLRQMVNDAVREQHRTVRYVLPRIIGSLDAELERIRTEGPPNLERQAVFVPDAFRGPYRQVFPDIYERVRAGLVDASRLEVALVEIFSDFVARWASTFDAFEDYHRTYLDEATDRTIAAENVRADAVGARESAAPPLSSGVRLRALAADVIRCVDEECRRLGGGETPDGHATDAVMELQFIR